MPALINMLPTLSLQLVSFIMIYVWFYFENWPQNKKKKTSMGQPRGPEPDSYTPRVAVLKVVS